MAADDRPRRHPDTAFRPVGEDGGLVVLPTRQEVKVLNPVGIKIFSLLDGEHTIAQIARAVVEEFEEVGMERIAARDAELLEYATASLSAIPGLHLIGTASERSAIISFVLEGIHPHDAATVLDLDGIAVRAGHHCAQPVMSRFGLPATVRASLAFYNTRDEIDALAAGVRRVLEVFR